jgi:EmrB/QacA subfamily drug resistance transporter
MRRRWLILAVLCLSIFVIVMDGTIVNVTLPTLVRDLHATNSDLQWIVDAYTLVFAGLLLAAGSLGDRWGRKKALTLGMAWFGTTSAIAAFCRTPDQLIAARAAMGVGAALIFPATLAILTNVFTEPVERAKAIGIWAAVSGLSVALGPVTGGWLLEHYWWGSVFLINVPIVAVALILGRLFVPESRDPHAQRTDWPGLALSIAGVTGLVWAVIEAPDLGWGSPRILAAFAVPSALLAGFGWWELRSSHPMLDVRIFRNLRFSAASLSVTVAFFALYGFVFMVTQYFQFVRGYSTFGAGLRTVPFAVAAGVASPIAPRLAQRFGTKVVVAWGLLSMGIGFMVAASCGLTTPYSVLVVSMAFMGSGLGFVSAPATESIMGSLPPDRAGVGSAVNDTTRELGGTLGVAVAGSVVASVYAGKVADGLAGTPVPHQAVGVAQQSVGAAYLVAERATQLAGVQAGAFIRGVASHAFLDGFGLTSRVLAVVAMVGAVAALAWLPSRAADPSEAETETEIAVDAQVKSMSGGGGISMDWASSQADLAASSSRRAKATTSGSAAGRDEARAALARNSS